MSDPYTLVERFEHEGLTVELHTDEDAGNPFVDWDQAAELILFSKAAREWDFKPADVLDEDRFVSVAHAARYLTLMQGYLVAIPFELNDYGSSGLQARLTGVDADRAAGFVAVHPRGIELTGAPDPLEAARQDFEVFREYVEGEVLGFVVKEARGAVLDSCWGFHGGVGYCREEAKASATAIAEERARLRSLPWLPTFGNPILANERG